MASRRTIKRLIGALEIYWTLMNGGKIVIFGGNFHQVLPSTSKIYQG